jgi:hypothetical protein
VFRSQGRCALEFSEKRAWLPYGSSRSLAGFALSSLPSPLPLSFGCGPSTLSQGFWGNANLSVCSCTASRESFQRWKFWENLVDQLQKGTEWHLSEGIRSSHSPALVLWRIHFKCTHMVPHVVSVNDGSHTLWWLHKVKTEPKQFPYPVMSWPLKCHSPSSYSLVWLCGGGASVKKPTAVVHVKDSNTAM